MRIETSPKSTIFPPVFPVKTITFNFFVIAAFMALIMFVEFPLVEIQTNTSPSLPNASICREKIDS